MGRQERQRQEVKIILGMESTWEEQEEARKSVSEQKWFTEMGEAPGTGARQFGCFPASCFFLLRLPCYARKLFLTALCFIDGEVQGAEASL